MACPAEVIEENKVHTALVAIKVRFPTVPVSSV
jgi:hypothetical protein